MVDLNILRIDLDAPTRTRAINIMKQRLSYFHDLGFYNYGNIKNIILIKKRTYAVKIILTSNLKEYNSVILFESLLGSDFRKQVNSLINFHILEMKIYPNRLFTIKRYTDGSYLVAEEEDVTKEIISYIYNVKRKKWKN